MGTKDDLHRIERELERSHKQVSDVSAPETARPLLPPAKASKPHSSLDLILGLAAALAVVGLGVNTVRQMPDQQAKTLERRPYWKRCWPPGWLWGWSIQALTLLLNITDCPS